MASTSKPRPPQIPKSTPTQPDPFASLPSFDPAKFEPPAWARQPLHTDKPGESSRAGAADARRAASAQQASGEEDDAESLGLSEQDEVWEDAVEEHDLGVDEAGRFTLVELKRLYDKASTAKVEGNAHFTARPPRHDDAIASYRAALKCLPEPTLPDPGGTSGDGKDGEQAAKGKLSPTGKSGGSPSEQSANGRNPSRGSQTPASFAPPPPPAGSGIQELTEDEAAALEAELNRSAEGEGEEPAVKAKTEEEEREELMFEITELRKVCLGNLGAVYLAMEGKEAECVEACKEALKIDPRYVKALQRRATANERIGTWSALSSAQEDYTLLLTLLPSTHPSLPSIQRCLAALPDRLKQQQDKEKDEMLAKLKDLGNGLLGRFGLSTDMFKFDQQDGGGYSMRFER